MKFIKNNFELIFWLAALVALAISSPSAAHFTLCPLRLLGFGWCPGCGVGHAISYLLHGQITASLHSHWLGMPALIAIVYRIAQLLNGRVIAFRLNQAVNR